MLTTFTYDPLGRQASKREPRSDSGTATRNTFYASAGLSTTIRVTSRSSQPTGACSAAANTALDDELCVKRTIAGDDTLIRTTDAHGNATRFWANSRGQMALIENSQGELSAARYNALDQRTALSDPDMGRWTFAYTGAGELIEQTDAKGQTFDFHYDALGRLIVRDVQGSVGLIRDVWVYDRPAAGLLERTRRLIDNQPVFDRKRSFQTVIDQPAAGLITVGRRQTSPSRPVAPVHRPGWPDVGRSAAAHQPGRCRG